MNENKGVINDIKIWTNDRVLHSVLLALTSALKTFNKIQTKQDKTRQNKTRQNKTRQDKTKQNKIE